MRNKKDQTRQKKAQQSKPLYSGSTFLQEKYGTTVLNFLYDANGTPYALQYSTNSGSSFTTYYYITNLQGDVIGLMNSSGTLVVSYTYDSWGMLLSTTGSLASTVGAVNPLRYRGYYYDTETALYYLQSRYYDPQVGRFINADAFASTGQGIVGYNMYAYCLNCPVMYIDVSGLIPQAVWDKTVHDEVLSRICADYENLSYENTRINYADGGYGFCDLYNTKTGEVWELKKYSSNSSPSITTYNASRQLDKYIAGTLVADEGLGLKRPEETQITASTFTFDDGMYKYYVTYWHEGDGILRYSYSAEMKLDTTTALLCILGGAARGLAGGGGADVIDLKSADPTDIGWAA